MEYNLIKRGDVMSLMFLIGIVLAVGVVAAIIALIFGGGK